MKTLTTVTAIALMGIIVLAASNAYAKERNKGRGATGLPIIFVTSQDLYYDTLILKELPFNDTENFQRLEMAGPTGVQTEFGPTNTEYYGGRWWVDANGNGQMDAEGDVYFLCPLLGPGRTTP